MFKSLSLLVAVILTGSPYVHAVYDPAPQCENFFYKSEFADTLKHNGLSVGDLNLLKSVDPVAAAVGFELPEISAIIEAAPLSFFNVIALSTVSIGFEAEVIDTFTTLFAEMQISSAQLPEAEASKWKQTLKRLNAAYLMVNDVEIPLVSQELEKSEATYFAFVHLLSSLPSPSPVGFSESYKGDPMPLYERFLKVRRSPYLTLGNLIDQSKFAQKSFIGQFCTFLSVQRHHQDLIAPFQQYLLGETPSLKPPLDVLFHKLTDFYKFAIKQKDQSFLLLEIGRTVARMITEARRPQNVPSPFTTPRIINFASQYLDEDTLIDRGLKSHLLIPIVELYTGQGVASAEQARFALKNVIAERYRSLRRAVKALKQSRGSEPTRAHTPMVIGLKGVPEAERIVGLPYKIRERQKPRELPVQPVPEEVPDELVNLKDLRANPELLEKLQPGQRLRVRFERTGQTVQVTLSESILKAFRERGKGASPMTEPLQWLDALSLGPAGHRGEEGIRKLTELYNGKYDWELKVARWPDRIFGYVDGSGCFHFQVFGRMRRH